MTVVEANRALRAEAPKLVIVGRGADPRADTTALLDVRKLSVRVPVRRAGAPGARPLGWIQPVHEVSFTLNARETLAVVGEPGCGKTTLLGALGRLVEPASGTVSVHGVEITRASGRQLAHIRRHMHIVFSDARSSLNPRVRVEAMLATTLRLRGVQRASITRQSIALLERTHLGAAHLRRFARELSGAEPLQVALARALGLGARLILIDDPFAGLDVMDVDTVIDLLAELRDDLGLSYLIAARDPVPVAQLCDRIAVMNFGKLVEVSPSRELRAWPQHPYTSMLLGETPVLDPAQNGAGLRRMLAGEAPSPLELPEGCAFQTRCPRATEVCRTFEPLLVEPEPERFVACHHPQRSV